MFLRDRAKNAFYSCTFVINPTRFPEYAKILKKVLKRIDVPQVIESTSKEHFIDSVREFCRRHGVPPRITRLLCGERKIAHDVQRLLLRRRQKKIVPKNSEMYRWLKPLSLEAVLYLMARCQSDEVRQWISNYYTHLRAVSTSLNGNDLRRLNIPKGPHYKKILDTLLDARLNGRVSSRDEEISFIKKRFSRFISG